MNIKSQLGVTLLCAASVIALTSAARAQNSDASTESVTVTGSRILTNGNDLPTPVTVVSIADLEATTPSNIPDGLNKLPVFSNSGATPNTAENGANGRGNGAVGNYLNLRNFGSIRNLVLQDGNRVPGTFYDTTVDTDMLPQLLIQRVEVVTGGASAVYGSDAVTGVVNFITDNKFEGLKGVVQGGISTYGDARSFRAGIAGGMDVLDHGHFIWSAEFYDRDAINNTNARPYGNGSSCIVGSGTVANPDTYITNCLHSNETFNGLILTGAAKNQYFTNDGSALQPFCAGTATGTTNIVSGGCGSRQHDEFLIPVINTGQVFGRLDYDFANDIHGYIEARYALDRSFEAGQHISNTATGYPLYAYTGNAFLTPAEQTALFAGGVTGVQYARDDTELSHQLGLLIQTGALSTTAGLSGKTFGDFSWDVHYTHGENRTQNATKFNVNAQRLYAAVDAVKDPSTGNIVCRVSITAPGAYPGCVPLDLFGGDSVGNQAAYKYVQGITSWAAHNGMDDFGGNVTGTAFNDWAGPVKVAAGVEYRLASLNVTTTDDSNTFNPQYLRVDATGDSLNIPSGNLGWLKEVQSGATGAEDVAESNIEFDVPLLKDVPAFELLSLNGAYRYTAYSAHGEGSRSNFSSNTWKLGVEWQVFDDLKFRATRSRDIRAPTLWDLYQEQETSSSGINDPLTSLSGSINTVVGGNPNLKPEKANDTTAGLVYTPGWLPNFSTSIDYYHIDIGNAIGSVNGLATNVQALCLASPGGSSPYCALVVRPISYNSTLAGNFPTLIYSLSQNVVDTYGEGVDLEANYETDLSQWTGMDGFVNLRLLWSHTQNFKSVSLPGARTVNTAGSQATPKDKGTFTIGYKNGNFSANILERVIGVVVRNTDQTIIYNIPRVIPIYAQTDVGFDYDFVAEGQPLTGFLTIDNLFNTHSEDVGGSSGAPGMNYPAETGTDIIGRYFTLGVRFKM